MHGNKSGFSYIFQMTCSKGLLKPGALQNTKIREQRDHNQNVHIKLLIVSSRGMSNTGIEYPVTSILSRNLNWMGMSSRNSSTMDFNIL